ncbi:MULTISPECIES: glycoside hydrolase family 53 protein [Bacteroides]|uniref:glycoside hydrolase family 53 protein n=1 Tax=Bacteroides TaxID=816 RepID=UPI000B3792AA|nr:MULTISPECIES: glycosyl hydrolase 53 family protein [Bacteroides]MBM6945293.1 glycosyl hydrolase 53 family protein [Bacteroides gallinaceum]OUO63075.1 arabinogalactan endo-1,4-beta-galactosidase [Bacteroides sp. An279]
MKLKHLFLSGLLLLGTAACNDDNDTPVFPEDPVYDMSGFVRGADVSWLTQMEASGVRFYTADGRGTECMSLLRELGFNAIRLRVWVNPADGWCNQDDVLAKAWRAHQLGYRLMIDFHYSDTWADPSAQFKPAAWEGLALDELHAAIRTHTQDVLNALKAEGITPEWIQVGNETGPGMLWDTDQTLSGAAYDIQSNGITYPANPTNYAAFITTGSRAAKEVFPETKVIVHVQSGDDNGLFQWNFGLLEENGAEYDVIGMSLYPDADNWQEMLDACVANMQDVSTRYGKEVMICETGMNWDEDEAALAFLTELLSRSREIPACLGVFYWEPQCYSGWNGYFKGAFDDNGRPTIALDAFK